MDGLNIILGVIIFDQDYSEDCLTRIGLGQCIFLLVVLMYHYIGAIKLLLLGICWFTSFLLLVACNTLLLLWHVTQIYAVAYSGVQLTTNPITRGYRKVWWL